MYAILPIVHSTLIFDLFKIGQSPIINLNLCIFLKKCKKLIIAFNQVVLIKKKRFTENCEILRYHIIWLYKHSLTNDFILLKKKAQK